jgi:hypothetical protein
MTARIPKVGEQGWTSPSGQPVELLAVISQWAWVRTPEGLSGHIIHMANLVPPQPTVTHLRYLWTEDEIDTPNVVLRGRRYDCAEARLERLSDGTWRVTNLKDETS